MFVSGRLKADFTESEMDELMSAVISEVRDTEMLLLKPTQKNWSFYYSFINKSMDFFQQMFQPKCDILKKSAKKSLLFFLEFLL